MKRIKYLSAVAFLIAAFVASAEGVRVHAEGDCEEVIQNCPQFGGFAFACYPTIDCFKMAYCLEDVCPNGWYWDCADHGTSYGGAEGPYECWP